MSIESPPSRGRTERGQALVETLVVALALVPLAVLVVLLGKYQSMQSATVAASRSLAFDCAARPASCVGPGAAGWLAEALRSRHFARPDRAVVSGERVGAGAVPGRGAAGPSGGATTGPASAASIDSHPLWQDRAGRPLLERLDHVGAVVSDLSFDAGLGTAVGRAASADTSGIGVPRPSGGPSGPIGTPGRVPISAGVPVPAAAEVLGRLAGPARFGLDPEGGLLDARVEVSVARSFAGGPGFTRLEPLALNLRARTAILSDSWQASGPRSGASSVAARVEAGARLDAIRETRLVLGYQLTRWTLDLTGGLGLEPAARHFRYHEADPEIVPTDRLGPQ